MAQATLVYKTPAKSIGGITVDAFMSENYNFSNEVSEIPIEEGVTVTDNVIENPDEIQIEGFFGKYEFKAENSMSDQKLASISAKIPNVMQRVKRYYQELLRLKKAREPLTLVTGLDTFDNMVITNLNIPRDVQTGADLHFTMSLKKLPIIHSETVQISVSNAPVTSASDMIQSTAETGTQAKQQADNDIIKQTRKQWVKNGMMSKEDYLKWYPNEAI